MGQLLHGSATTTEAVRRAIQHRQESLRALAHRHGIKQKTVAKWKKRRSTADLPARPPLAHLVGRPQIRRSLPMRGGRPHFFPSRSFSATLSSIASPSIRFRRPFSSSSTFSRLASDTSSPPNLALHL